MFSLGLWRVLCGGILVVTVTVPGLGQGVQRAFVSAQTGVDTNPCTNGAPCRTFTRAHDVVMPEGEIVALDSGGYGPFQIFKSLRVVAVPGALVTITATSAAAIRVHSPQGSVSLKNLTLTGLGGVTGVNATALRMLKLENCVVQGFIDGVRVDQNANSNVQLRNVEFLHCSGQALDLIGSAQGRIEALVAGCNFMDNEAAILTANNINCVIRDTLFQDNDVAVQAINGVNRINIQSCTFASNYVAIYGGTAPGAVIALGNSTLTGNFYARVGEGPGDILTYGNNQVFNNYANEHFVYPISFE